MIYLYWMLGIVALLPFTWVLYISIMGFKEHKAEMGKVSLTIAYIILPFGLLADALFNFTWGSIMFLEFPKELLMTTRLKRHLSDHKMDWRDRNATWFCKEFLNIYDSTGNHC